MFCRWAAHCYWLVRWLTLYETGPFFLLGVHYPPFTLGCLLVRTGNELIAFHALQGIAMAFAMPTAVGLITSNFPTGRGRNIAFACLGGGSPIGFALGVVLNGLFVYSIGRRHGCYPPVS